MIPNLHFNRWPLIAIALLLIISQRSGTLTAQTPEYRTYDGSGNNLANATWGSTNTQLSRLNGSAYEDGLSEPRGGGLTTAATLPSGRAISSAVAAQTESVPNASGISSILWQWGQFIDHDIDLTEPLTPTEPFTPTESFPILVPTGDPFFDPSNSGTAEIALRRSDYDEATGTSNPREQRNHITAWIDASQVYGSDQGRADWKRSFVDGKLAMSDGNLLPFEPQPCPETNGVCFAAGDIRANEQIGLIAMHTLFVREHNRLADLILADNPSLTDEEIYQRARLLVAAEIQIITYNEFLRHLLGSDALPAYTGYDANVNATIQNEFSTAAFRVGHTMLPSVLLRLDENGNEIANGHVALRNAFFTPQLVIDDGIEPILRGLALQPAQEIDTLLVDDVRNFLFGPPGSGGFDLASLNIQRGREHGLPSYNAVRLSLGLGSVSSFAEITPDPALQNALATVYNNDVEQIDLWVGGLAEEHLPGALVGETFHAIISNQFQRLRDGDRFWHQNIDWSSYDLATDPIINLDGSPLSQTTLSDIIRWNTTITSIQDNPFSVAELTINTPHSIIYPGDTLTVTLTAHANSYYGLQTTCTSSDPTILTPQSATFSDAFTSPPHLIATNQIDSDSWTGALTLRNPAEPLSGAHPFATLTFQAGTAGDATLTCQPLFADRDGIELISSSPPLTITISSFGNLEGNLTTQGRLQHPDITITATNTDTNHTTTTNPSGDFTLLNLTNGTYDIQADVPLYLPACTTADINPGDTTTLSPATLRGGDANDDDTIDIADASLITGAFNENVPPADARGDINDDGVINVQDFSILGGNYELSGCQTW